MRFRTAGWPSATRAMLVGVLACAPIVAAGLSQPDAIRVVWKDASGPVSGYEVYISVNDAPGGEPVETPDNELVLTGADYQRGDALRFRVVAVAADGRRGEPSKQSDVIFFLGPPAPQGLMADGGSTYTPTTVSWDPVRHVEFYVVFRSESPEEVGSLFDVAEMPYAEDHDASLGITYYYRVAAIKGRQVSEFSQPIEASREPEPPVLHAEPLLLKHTAAPGETSATQIVNLYNTGDWAISFTATASAPWVSLSASAGQVDRDPLGLSLTYDLASMAPGPHQANLTLRSSYASQSGEPVAGQPIAIPIVVSIPNRPPVLDPLPWVALQEGQASQISITATDPDVNQALSLSVSNLPGFATFTNTGGGSAVIDFAPDSLSSGQYFATVVASDGVEQVSRPLNVLVQNVNHVPALTQVPDTIIPAGQTSTIEFEAWDPDVADRLAFSSSTLPDFATLQDHGNRTATLLLEPDAGDIGTHLVIVAVVDDGTPVKLSNAFFYLQVE